MFQIVLRVCINSTNVSLSFEHICVMCIRILKSCDHGDVCTKIVIQKKRLRNMKSSCTINTADGLKYTYCDSGLFTEQ